MFDLIFTGDTIDQGRKKINDLLFTGFTSSGFWSPLNSGSTGFSLEFSAISPSYLTNNVDSSENSSNIIVGNNNIILGSGGYNFIQGSQNSLSGISNSFVAGYNINITGLTDSFIQGENITIFSGNYITVLGSDGISISSNTTNNNYISLLGNLNLNLEGNPISSNPNLNFLTIIGSSGTNIQADCEYVSVINGANNIISGTVKNCLIFGSNNNIGYNQSNNQYSDIYIFGSGLSPVLSATTNVPLSGTYINDLCIENQLIHNFNGQIITQVDSNGTATFNNYNIFNIGAYGSTNFHSTFNGNKPSNSNSSGLFFITYENIYGVCESCSGSTTMFTDYYNGANNGRWDMPSNYLSANTVFMNYIDYQGVNGYIKIKG